MRARIVVVVLLVAALVGDLLVRSRPSSPDVDGAEAGARSSVASERATVLADAARFPHAVRDQARRDELRAKLLVAAAQAEAEARAEAEERAAGHVPMTRGNRETNDIAELGRFVTQAVREDFMPMADACVKDLATRSPDAGGAVTVAFELLGDAKIGGVVNDVSLEDAGAPLGDETFATCLRESMYGVYFDPPPAGGRATLNFPVTVRGGAMDDHVDEFHLRDRRNEPRSR